MAPRYAIRVSGRLDEAAREAFVGLQMQSDADQVVLSGELDQAALHGLLERIRVLGLTLVDVRRARNVPHCRG